MGGFFAQRSTHATGVCSRPLIPRFDALRALTQLLLFFSVCKTAPRFLLKHTPLATRAPQMLLVPVDTDAGHADEAYAGTNPRPGDDDAHQDSGIVSGVQPSKSLLAGADYNDDDDEVTDGEVENGQSSSAAESFGHGGAFAEPAEWEHIPPPGALQVESVVSVQPEPSAIQREQETVMPTSAGGCSSSQRVFGKWPATNVLRQGSVPGVLYLYEESLVFESERSEIEDSEEATATWLQQHAGKTWRWRLGRLTQVTHVPARL